ncbi:histone-like nucleoid-structuring protein Lsr2 [Pseudonocardia benzenivorans]|jgi:hypothetical protein|uniref:Lsr2-like protein n=2 Tax=Pseudonocardia TaxID=1847 RepID=F4CP81_PSEUX|nr:histone-like nucleoid-structuring protein Lsr2 [Pseudonocardia dioxanivorans]AEA23640.1 hypothetical protein Psed_1400 [Pseudonocardia dioxanivorans CB1190]GJF06018.1 hypothetical protein PSD17_49660 [Pseudonocardia sp. D17]
MGIREIRYCDVSGTEEDVETHELNIDQMHVRIDLAGVEYRKLLALLQPYLDAGTIEASVPGYGTGRPAARTSTGLTAEERTQLRLWAEAQGIEVPSNNRFKRSLVERWRARDNEGAADSGEYGDDEYDEYDGDDEYDSDEDGSAEHESDEAAAKA